MKSQKHLIWAILLVTEPTPADYTKGVQFERHEGRHKMGAGTSNNARLFWVQFERLLMLSPYRLTIALVYYHQRELFSAQFCPRVGICARRKAGPMYVTLNQTYRGYLLSDSLVPVFMVAGLTGLTAGVAEIPTCLTRESPACGGSSRHQLTGLEFTAISL